MRKSRILEERFFTLLCRFASYSLALLLLCIILVIFIKGFSALTIKMIIQTPKGGFYFGGEGGVLNAIAGSAYLAFGATLIAVVIGAPAALYLNIHLLNKRKIQNTIRYFLDTLWGIPSIVYGAFGFTVMIYMGMNASLLAGIITVAMLILPIMVRTFDEVLCTTPVNLQEAAYALGSTRAEVAVKVVFKRSISGFITAILLAFGRGIGDAASVLFTAGYTDLIPRNLDEPVATLPLAIFFQLGSPIPEVRERAFASASILTVIILIVSLGSRYFSRKYAPDNQGNN